MAELYCQEAVTVGEMIKSAQPFLVCAKHADAKEYNTTESTPIPTQKCICAYWIIIKSDTI